MKLMIDKFETEIGGVVLVTNDHAMVSVDFEDHTTRLDTLLRKRYEDITLEETNDPLGYTTKLRSYFDGKIDVLDEIDVETGGTPFQATVWKELRRVRAGQTATYSDIAQRVGNPKAVRAVGTTNGRNPVTLVVPCHRIIGANGALTGYAQGVDRKRWLLKHEGALLG